MTLAISSKTQNKPLDEISFLSAIQNQNPEKIKEIIQSIPFSSQAHKLAKEIEKEAMLLVKILEMNPKNKEALVLAEQTLSQCQKVTQEIYRIALKNFENHYAAFKHNPDVAHAFDSLLKLSELDQDILKSLATPSQLRAISAYSLQPPQP